MRLKPSYRDLGQARRDIEMVQRDLAMYRAVHVDENKPLNITELEADARARSREDEGWASVWAVLNAGHYPVIVTADGTPVEGPTRDLASLLVAWRATRNPQPAVAVNTPESRFLVAAFPPHGQAWEWFKGRLAEPFAADRDQPGYRQQYSDPLSVTVSIATVPPAAPSLQGRWFVGPAGEAAAFEQLKGQRPTVALHCACWQYPTGYAVKAGSSTRRGIVFPEWLPLEAARVRVNGVSDCAATVPPAHALMPAPEKVLDVFGFKAESAA